MSSSPPLVVADRYRLVAPLGQGGMGRVWRATDVVLHREVAIKELVPPPGLTAGERQEMRERSLREARAIARLNNINVVRVFDVLRTDADPWIVMEYVPSRSLQDTLASDGPFNPVRAAEIGLGVLGALRAAHRAGVVHRDVKPGNVLIGADGRVVLTDFGLATVPGDPNVTRTGLVLGSPAYIAPERARDGTAGPAADLWSLGATLYAAVEGASPFARPSAIATLAALATENPPPARNAGSLKPVLNGLLRKDPTHRINAEEAERLLNRAAGRRARLAFPMSPTMRRPGAGRERPGAILSPTGSAPVVPGPRPPVAPARPVDPPGRPPVSGGRPAVGEGRPPVYVPGKAPVGRPASDTPTRVDGPKVDAPRLDATRVDTPPVRDDKAPRFGTRPASTTAPGQPPAARPAQPGAAPATSPARPGATPPARPGAGPAVPPGAGPATPPAQPGAAPATLPARPGAGPAEPPARPGTGAAGPPARTSRGERGTSTASDVAAGRQQKATPQQPADATALVGRTPAPDATTVVGPLASPAAEATTVVGPLDKTAAGKPAVEKPTVDRQAMENPVRGQSATGQSVSDRPVSEQSAAGQSVAEQSATDEQSATEQPSTGQSVAEQPVTAKPAAEKPTVDEPAVEKPAATKPATRKQKAAAKKAALATPAAPASKDAQAEETATDERPADSASAPETAPAEPEGDRSAESRGDQSTEAPEAAAEAVEAKATEPDKAGKSDEAETDAQVQVPLTRRAPESGDAGSEAPTSGDPSEAPASGVPSGTPVIGAPSGTPRSGAPSGAPESHDAPAPVSPVPVVGRPTRPAWRPMAPSPTPSGITVFGTRLTYRQAAVGAAVLLLVLVLLITLVAKAFGGGDQDPTGTRPNAIPTNAGGAQPSAAGPSNAATTTPSAPETSAPETSATPSPAASAPGAIALPADWTWYTAPATGDAPGFTLPIPKNAKVSGGGTELQFRWNNRLLILGRSNSPQADAYEDWKNQEASRRGTYRNYNFVRLERVKYRDYESVADWEFFYTTSRGNSQHVVRRNIRVDSSAAFSLNWYVSSDDWAASQSDLQLLYQGFQPK